MKDLDNSEIDSIFSEAENISTWDQWNEFENKWFDHSGWPERNREKMYLELERPPFNVAGVEWRPLSDPYDIMPKLRTTYEIIHWKVFDKLEPEAALENQQNPQNFGKVCYYELIWTRNFQSFKCPLCGRDTLPIPLNDD